MSDKYVEKYKLWKTTGNKKIFDALVMDMSPLVKNLIKKFHQRWKTDVDDLYQVGFIGVTMGIKKFDDTKGGYENLFWIIQRYTKNFMLKYVERDVSIVKYVTTNEIRKEFLRDTAIRPYYVEIDTFDVDETNILACEYSPDVSLFCKQVLDNLGESKKSIIFKTWLDLDSYSETGKIHRVTKQYVEQVVKSVSNSIKQ